MPRRDEELNPLAQTVQGGQAIKPSYAGTFDSQLADLFERISNRPKFSYDVNADPLYEQYKDKYIQGGKLAMRDTMGKAAGLTGGYGSSYGQAVGQQAYDAYLQDLSAVIPELYGMAYDQYKDEGDELLKQYGLVGDQRDTEYSRYRDDLGDWERDREYQRQVETEEYNRRIAEEQTAYNRQRDAETRKQQLYANLYAAIKASGYTPSDAELATAGMSREQAAALAAEFQRGVDLENRNQALKEWQIGMQVYGGGGGGGYSGGGGGGYSYSGDTLAIQRQLNAMGAGIAEDGLWGPETQAAYDAYMGGGYSGGGSYNLGELADASAAGASRSQIEAALAARGVDTSSAAVQQDIKWALSK